MDHLHDSSELRVQSAVLRGLAQEAAAVADRLERELTALTSTGPMAEQLRGATHSRVRTLRYAADELDAVADAVAGGTHGGPTQ